MRRVISGLSHQHIGVLELWNPQIVVEYHSQLLIAIVNEVL